ncbi:MAG: hypothetical protein JRI68_01495 [Deltaproteobacteria bacterium]|nr:hypothetical protein [Deltaproteobacteria bacterium]
MTSSRRAKLHVFVAAWAVMFAETTLFHILRFTHSYLHATLVIAYALLGLCVGSLAAYFVKGEGETVLSGLQLVLAASLILASCCRPCWSCRSLPAEG